MSSNLDFRAVFDAALTEYFNKTGNDIVQDPLVKRLESCSSPEDVLGILQEQAQAFNEFRQGEHIVQLMRKLRPTVDILFVLSNAGFLGNAVSLSFPPASAIFAGIGLLLAAAKRVGSSYDMLIDLFQCFENYLGRLRILTEIPDSMKGILVKIMVELLDVLALATRQIKQGRFKNFAKKLVGKNDVEAVLHRLDRLTMEESRMTAAQTMEVVHGLFNNMKGVMDDGKMSIDNIREALVTMQEISESLNKAKRDELQKSVRQWLSPPDPSINQNVACGVNHKMTATWFTEGVTYKIWKARGSLLWIRGKPGSGKSVLCSTIIEDLEDLRRAGLASLAYYYFDFKDSGKQDRRGLLASLLVQLSARSDASCEILNRLYSDHENGSRQPREDRLIQCLKEVLAAQKGEVYVIIDAVDECPNNYGMPTSREMVLELLNELASLQFSHVHFCITSRPEVDIRIILEPLTSHIISLHDEGGQRKDILDYINSVIESDLNTRRWREEDKQLVINALAQKADGMFRWAFCQLDTLRRCFPGSIRRALDELPSTLDETYEQILRGIDEEKWEHAHRLLQCLAVSRRPLRVKELAEVLTMELDARGMPKLNVGLRPRDADKAILSACSTLIAIFKPDVRGRNNHDHDDHNNHYDHPDNPNDRDDPVDSDDSIDSDVYDYYVGGNNDHDNDFWIVQFSHYSVKEYLTSSRLEFSRKGLLSRFHVSPEPAHTILVQSCVSTLLQAGDDVDNPNFPLADYAARNWVDHAQVNGIASHIQIEMESLFDPEKPHFAAWVHIREPPSDMSRNCERSPISLAAYYDFEDVVKHLVTTRRRYTNVSDPVYGPPLCAAVERGKHEVVQFLLEHAADVNVLNPQDFFNRTPLLLASDLGKFDIVRSLLDRGADVNSRDILGSTSLHAGSRGGHFDIVQQLVNFGADINARDDCEATPLYMAFQTRKFDIMQLLLERGADVNSWDSEQSTPLHQASESGHLNVVRQLIYFGADINARDYLGATPLHKASRFGEPSVVQLLLQQGASTNAQDHQRSTPLHEASEGGSLDLVQQLINFGADINAHDNTGATPLHKASLCGRLDVVQLFLELGVSTNTLDHSHSTPLHEASEGGSLYVVQQLINFGADINARDDTGATPLHKASRWGRLDVVQLLLEQGVNLNALDHWHSTPLHDAVSEGSFLYVQVVQQLIKFGADVNACNYNGTTPLHRASRYGRLDVVQLLLEQGVSTNVLDHSHSTPLHEASEGGHSDVARQLINFGADLNIRDNKGATPLLKASRYRRLDVLQLLLERGADVNLQDEMHKTPLHEASSCGRLNVAQKLIKLGADVNARDSQGYTPLHKASRYGNLDIVQLLLQQGANVNTRDNLQLTPLYEASKNEHIDVVRQLIDFGAELNAGKDGYQTPLHLAAEERNSDITSLLLLHGADPNPRNERGCTPLHVASTLGCIDVISLLLDRGASVNPREEHLQTPLHLAALSGCTDSVRRLLERGADVDARNELGQTPFSLAMESGNRKCARLISDWGSIIGSH